MAIVLDGTNGIDTPDLASAGPISGTTGTFSGAVSGTTGTFSGAVSGTTGTFSGAVQASGVATNLYPLVSGTAVASTSGTSIDFTSIPSWVKRVTVMFNGVSTNGTSNLQVQIGSGSITTSGYNSTSSTIQGTAATSSYTTGFGLRSANATDTISGQMVLTLLTGNTWVESCVVRQQAAGTITAGGDVSLSGTLDRVRITTVNGTDTFDAGSINILYE